MRSVKIQANMDPNFRILHYDIKVDDIRHALLTTGERKSGRTIR
jgi:hypothetical protein